MGFMIQLLFEPSIGFANHVWCTSCGTLMVPEQLVFETSSTPGSARDADGGDIEMSPHYPVCPRCGEKDRLDNIVFDGNELKLSRHMGLRRRYKPMKVWIQVEPYRTKRGKISTWKRDEDEEKRLQEIWDRLDARLEMRTSMIDDDPDEDDESEDNSEDDFKDPVLIGDVFQELFDNYGDIPITIGVLELASRSGLVAIYSKEVWHPKSPWQEAKKYRWVKSRTKGSIEPVWIDMKSYDTALNECGYSMDRGRLHTDADGYQLWYDPQTSSEIRVFDPDQVYVVQYDESQGSSTDDIDEEAWIANAYENSSIRLEVSDETLDMQEEES